MIGSRPQLLSCRAREIIEQDIDITLDGFDSQEKEYTLESLPLKISVEYPASSEHPDNHRYFNATIKGFKILNGNEILLSIQVKWI